MKRCSAFCSVLVLSASSHLIVPGQAKAAPAAQPLRVMTFNVPFFPPPIGEGKRTKRLKAFLKTVRSMRPLPDVITLQEIWTAWAKDKIARGLKRLYPHQYRDRSPGKYLILLNSGLMILSRHKILARTKLHYKRSTGEEKLARKGVLGVRIQLPNGKRVNVFTTHLQSTSKTKANNIKISQLTQARKLISRFTRKAAKEAVILTGDFNLSAEKSPTYLEKARALWPGSVDTFDPEKGDGTRYSTWNGLLGKGNSTAQRVDQIWILRGPASGYSYLLKVFGQKVSGHLAMWGELTVP